MSKLAHFGIDDLVSSMLLGQLCCSRMTKVAQFAQKLRSFVRKCVQCTLMQKHRTVQDHDILVGLNTAVLFICCVIKGVSVSSLYACKRSCTDLWSMLKLGFVR